MSRRRSLPLLIGAIVSSLALSLANAAFGQLWAQPISSGGLRPFAVDVDETNGLVYAVNHVSDSLAVLDLETNALLHVLPTDNEPAAVAVNEVTKKVYVSHYGSDYFAAGHTVKVFSPSVDDNGLVSFSSSTIDLGTNIKSHGIAVDSVLNKVFVANTGSNTVSVIDGSTDTIAATIAVGSLPMEIATNPVTGKVYVANYGGDLCQVSATDPTPVAYVNGACPAYTNNTSEVTVIDAATNLVIKSIRDGGRDNGPVTRLGGPWTLAVNTTTNRVYIGQRRAQAQEGTAPGRIGILDGSTDTLVDYFSATNGGRGPSAIAVDSTRNRLYWSPLANDFTTVRALDLSPSANGTRAVGGSFKSLGSANVAGNVQGIAVNLGDGSVFSASVGTTNSFMQSVWDNPTQVFGNPGVALICTPAVGNCNPGELSWIPGGIIF